MKVPNSRKTYAKPELITYGSMATITQGSSSGDFTDADFPAGTPFKSLTFS
jgi:hypothetical protein